jgi:plasmid maintenance system antidote protein VapI
MQEFKEYIKKKLEEKDISVNKLSEEIKVREVYLKDVIAGRRVSFPTIHKIAKYFDDPFIIYLYIIENLSRKFSESKRRSKKSKSKKEVQS